MTERNNDGRDSMQEAIRRRQERREAWEKQGERPLWKNLSMAGALGWLVVLPTVIGVFVGRWLDTVFATGVTFSGACTMAGAGLGFYLVWRRINEE